MGEQAWKVAEREVARRFGTEREGNKGKNWPDAISKAYAIEVKNMESVPLWLKEAIQQTQHNGRRAAPHNLPVVVIHEKGQSYDECMVIVPTVEQFVEWFGT